MEVAGSNHSNVSCFSDKLCNSPRFINHISSDEQSLEFKFSGSIRLLCLCLMHECEGWPPFQLRQCKAWSQVRPWFCWPLILLAPTESCNGKPMWSSGVEQPPLHGSWDNAIIWCLAPGGTCQQWHTRVSCALYWSEGALPAVPDSILQSFPFFQLLLGIWGEKPARDLSMAETTQCHACNGRSCCLNHQGWCLAMGSWCRFFWCDRH